MGNISNSKIESLLQLNTSSKKQQESFSPKVKGKKGYRSPAANRERQNTNYKPYADKPLSYFIKTTSSSVKAIKTKGERQTSKGERLIADWLVKNQIRFKREKEFVDLINPMTGKCLLIDFYLHKHRMCIEFDGRQHFKSCKMFDKNGDSLEARIQRDKIKDFYCTQKALVMVRIKYTDINRVDEILKTLFNT